MIYDIMTKMLLKVFFCGGGGGGGVYLKQFHLEIHDFSIAQNKLGRRGKELTRSHEGNICRNQVISQGCIFSPIHN